MSRVSGLQLVQSPTAARTYHPYAFEIDTSRANTQVQHQQRVIPAYVADNPPVQQRATQSPSVDWIFESLQMETTKHHETRLNLQSSLRTNVNLEQLLQQERINNHSLRKNLQEAEMKRIVAENKLRAYEQQIVDAPQSSPLSDYKSATFSPSLKLPSIINSPSDISARSKRKAYFTINNSPASKRPKEILSPERNCLVVESDGGEEEEE